MPIRLLTVIAATCLMAACRAPGPAEAPAVETPGRADVARPPPVAVEAGSDLPEAFIVSTNEPFWQARVEGQIVILAGPEGERTLRVRSNTATTSGRRVLASDGRGSLEVGAEVKPCQDDMSGAEFPFNGSLSFDGGEAVKGCARRATDPPPGEPAP